MFFSKKEMEKSWKLRKYLLRTARIALPNSLSHTTEWELCTQLHTQNSFIFATLMLDISNEISFDVRTLQIRLNTLQPHMKTLWTCMN